MADSTNSGNQAPKELSMETRLLLAFLLMGAVLFLTPTLFKPTGTPLGKKEPAATQAPAVTAPAATAPAGQNSAAQSASTEAVAPSAPATLQRPAQPVVIDTDLFHVEFSNHGATAQHWLLKKFKGNDGKPLDVVNYASNIALPFSLYFPDQKPAPDVNWVYYSQKADPDGLGVAFDYSDGHTSVHKVFRFAKGSYLLQVSTDVTADGQPVPHGIEWRGGFGDLTTSRPAAAERTLYFNVPQNKLVEQYAKAAKSGPVTASGDFSFSGIADTYFASVFLSENGGAMQQVTFSDTVPTPVDKTPAPFPGVATAEPGAPLNRFSLFVGPKDIDLLRRINPKLEQVVDFGWTSVLSKPLFLIVNWLNDNFVHNFGWAIVLITIFINFALFPLKLTNMKSMRKMQALQPQIAAINAKYKNVGLRDPKKAEQNQEVMELYKKHGVNPMGGCLPMALQMPFLFAFYRVFTVSVEMRGASWLWVTDLSQPEHLAIHILPLIMIVSQFLFQKMMPQTSADPNQQRMMMMTTLVFGFMFYNLPSGLVLYYLTSNFVQIGQQLFFNRTATAVEAAQSVQPKKKSGRN
jgi:YidC/Oxa1 family membrane protein insertase